jgi:signal transduction histidine kinase
VSARGSLTPRILMVLALATVTPTVIVGGLAIHHARSDLEREVVRGNLALIRSLGATLDQTLQSARRTLEIAAAGWADQRPAERIDDQADARATERLLRRLRREVSLLASLSVVAPDGDLLYGDPVPRDTGTGAHTFGGYVGDVAFDDGRPRVVVVAQARSRTGELVGAFVARLDLRFIAETLRDTRLGPGARLLVVDGDGIPVARSDGEPVAGGASLRGINPAVDRALGSVAEGDLETAGTVAVYRNLSGYQSLRGVRWAIILEQPTRDAYALAHKTTRDTLLVAIGVLGLALLIGFVLATRITRPLRQLAARADAIAGDDHDPAAEPPPAPVDAPGEIGLLAHRFEDMARRIGEREQLQAALARGDRLAHVGTMAASVAHEVNNPLTTVLGYANLLIEDKPDDHPDRAGLELIADEAARMKTIVGSLLDYSRAEKPDRTHIADVNALLSRTAALMAPQLRRSRVELALEPAEPLPKVAADAHALQQVLVNLVHNAAQAMPEGGRVTVASRLAGTEAVEVTVTDRGPGVPLGERERIFDAFYTTKDPGAGTGLGLAVCKHLIAQHGGSITVEDGPGGRGARFRVVIPIVE